MWKWRGVGGPRNFSSFGVSRRHFKLVPAWQLRLFGRVTYSDLTFFIYPSEIADAHATFEEDRRPISLHLFHSDSFRKLTTGKRPRPTRRQAPHVPNQRLLCDLDGFNSFLYAYSTAWPFKRRGVKWRFPVSNLKFQISVSLISLTFPWLAVKVVISLTFPWPICIFPDFSLT